MFIVDPEVSELVRGAYAKQRPDTKVRDISLVARKFGGVMAVVACEKAAMAEPEGVARCSEEVCYVSPKGEATCFPDIASFASFLILWERRSILAKWLNPYFFFRCVYVLALISATYGLEAAFDGGSLLLRIGSVVAVVSFSWLVIFQPSE